MPDMTKLRIRMAEQGWSTRTLARKVPCHYSLISKVRSGKKTPSMETAKRISEITGIAMEDLIADKGETK